ncbi:MAG: O-antigen ligase family protein [Candidatus Hodarchaeota archaeon]
MLCLTLPILIGAAFAFIVLYRLRGIIVWLGLFVLSQDLIVENVGGSETPIGGVIKKIDEVVIIAMILVIIMGRLAKGRTVARTPLDLPLAGIVTIGVLSSLVAEVPLFLWFAQLFLLIKGYLLFYVLTNIQLSEEDVKRFIIVYGTVAVMILILGFIDLALLKKFRMLIGNTTFIDWRAGLPAIQSIFVHPGVFGWFMAFIGLYVFAFSFIYQKPKYYVLSLLFLTGVFLSMRRKALGGLVAGLWTGIQVLPRSRKIRQAVLLIVITAISLTIAWPRFEFLYDEMMKHYIKRSDPSQHPRVALYVQGVEIAKDYFPLGAGLGRYASWISRVHYSPLYEKYGLSEIYGLSADNPIFLSDTFWPMILGEIGFIGLLFYFWIVIVLVQICHRATQLADTFFKKAFCLGTLMVVSEALIESIATPLFVKPPQVYFVLGAVGITHSLLRSQLRKKEGRY